MLGPCRGARTAGLLQGTLPSRLRDHDYSVPTSGVDSMQAVSDTGCRIYSATVNCKMQGGEILGKMGIRARRGIPILDSSTCAQAASLQPVADILPKDRS